MPLATPQRPSILTLNRAGSRNQGKTYVKSTCKLDCYPDIRMGSSIIIATLWRIDPLNDQFWRTNCANTLFCSQAIKTSKTFNKNIFRREIISKIFSECGSKRPWAPQLKHIIHCDRKGLLSKLNFLRDHSKLFLKLLLKLNFLQCDRPLAEVDSNEMGEVRKRWSSPSQHHNL